MEPKETKKALDALLKALEVGMYETPVEIKVSNQLKDFLRKLGIKSAKTSTTYGGALKIEGLDSILKQVTFDDKNIKLWKDIVDTKSQSQPIASGGGPSDCTSARNKDGT